MKSSLLAACALALSGLTLAACGSESSQPTQDASEAAPEAPAGIVVNDGRLVLPAVAGNPGAVYFDVVNDGEADAAVVAAEVQGAGSTMLHATVEEGGMASMKHMTEFPVAKGATLKFAPGGNHVMAMDLADTLKPGGTTEVTLTFASGDKASFPATILAAGEAR